MSEITTFFRHCPACGRRFEIRLEHKELVSVDRATSSVPAMEQPSSSANMPGDSFYLTSKPLMVRDDEPIITDTEEFDYTYKCKHCGHEWNEKREEVHREK